MTAAPTNEIAIGRKISDLAIDSPCVRRSASVANNRPMLTATVGTMMTQPAVLRIDLQHAGVAEHEAVVVEPDPVLPACVFEAREQRVDHGVDEEHREQHEGRPDVDVGPHALAPSLRQPAHDTIHRPEEREDAADPDGDRDEHDEDPVRVLVAEELECEPTHEVDQDATHRRTRRRAGRQESAARGSDPPRGAAPSAALLPE